MSLEIRAIVFSQAVRSRSLFRFAFRIAVSLSVDARRLMISESPVYSSEDQIRESAAGMIARFGETMFGLDEVARLCLVGFYCGGHVLLEGNPGLGKTDLVKKLAEILGLDFGRIQFTPDLMPADITGTSQPDFSDGMLSRFEFNPGPVLNHHILLGDEINRATPKTQAAMLEAMAEKQVTVLGTRRPARSPFMVLATQNPIDHEGTYSLPEAQLDRFLFHIDMPAPSPESIHAILRKTTGADSSGRNGATSTVTCGRETDEELDEQQRLAQQSHREIADAIGHVRPSPSLEQHVSNLVFAFDGAESNYAGSLKKNFRKARELAAAVTQYAIGPRAAIAMMKGAKAWSLLFGDGTREFASSSDLTQIVVPALRHRLKLDFSWREKFAAHAKLPAEHSNLLPLLVLELCSLTAPDDESFDIFRSRYDREVRV